MAAYAAGRWVTFKQKTPKFKGTSRNLRGGRWPAQSCVASGRECLDLTSLPGAEHQLPRVRAGSFLFTDGSPVLGSVSSTRCAR